MNEELIPTIHLSAKNKDEVRFLAIADPHLAASSPESWKADYRTIMLEAIRQVLAFGVKNDVDAVLWAGDLFHRKSPTRNPLWFVEECVKLLKESGLRNLGVAGNHDLKWGSLEGLPGQAISLIIEAGFYHLLDKAEYLFEGDGFTVRVAGASYEHGKAEECRAKKKKGATWLVSLGHFWFGSVDGVFNGEPLFSPAYLGQGESDIYVIGHKHDDQGIVEMDGKKYVVPGAISLTGEKAADSIRRPAAGFIRISKTGSDIKILRPRMPELSDLLNFEKRTQVLEESKALEEFVQTISTAKILATDPLQMVQEMDVAMEVREKAKYYLEQAAGSVK